MNGYHKHWMFDAEIVDGKSVLLLNMFDVAVPDEVDKLTQIDGELHTSGEISVESQQRKVLLL